MITKDDLKNYNVLKMILNNGDFQIKGNAIVPSANAVSWFNGFGQRMEKYLLEKDTPMPLAGEIVQVKKGKK